VRGSGADRPVERRPVADSVVGGHVLEEPERSTLMSGPMLVNAASSDVVMLCQQVPSLLAL
jgi:hypothetical protein